MKPGAAGLHPCAGELGEAVAIRRPSTPTFLAAWHDPGALATVVPGGAMPAALNGIAFDDWSDAPASTAGWAALAGAPIAEPPYVCPAGVAPAAGAVIVEADGRIWLVAPTNAFGGYQATFPKGRLDPGASLQCAALREAYEESGLRIALTDHLLDVRRTLTYTRYYLARRVGGNPARMGWESQAVHLVPLYMLAQVAGHPNDAAIIAAVAHWQDARR